MTGPGEPLAAAARTAIVLVVVLAGLRVAGRRHSGELQIADILLVLLLANAVQNAMTRGSGRLVIAFASALTLIAVGWFAGRLFSRSPSAERLLGGAPILLVHDGRIVRQNLRRQRVTDDELLAVIRKQGLASVSDVRIGVLEPNGSISIVPRRGEGETGR